MKKFFRVLGSLAALSFLAAVMSCVINPLYDDFALQRAVGELTITYDGSDKADYVTQDVTLSSSNISGVSVTWKSSDSKVIEIEGSVGKVTRPKEDTKVTLEATLQYGDPWAKKTFELTVIGTVSEELRQIIGKVTPPKGAIFGSDRTITLTPTVGSTTIAWTSDKPGIIPSSVSGAVTVTLPAAKTAVMLTATATKEGISVSKTFIVTVYPAGDTPTAKDLLPSIDFTAKKVSAGEQLTLPSEITGVSGTQITWTSDKPQSLTVDNGSSPKKATAHPGLRDVTVTLTATLTYNGETESKTFAVTVERITKAKDPHDPNATYTFTDSMITRIATGTRPDGHPFKNGIRWAYTLDQEKRQITAHKTHLFQENNWITLGSEEHKQQTKDSIVYDYSFRPFGSGSYSFETTAVYDSKQVWFKQKGEYKTDSGDVSFFQNALNTGFYYNGLPYNGTLNSEGTAFEGKARNGQTMKCNITDNKDGTISVSIAGTSETYTLNFRGGSLR